MMNKLALHWKIIIAIILAAIAGHFTGKNSAIFGVTFYSIYDLVGDLFLSALKMLIVPLITSSIIVGISTVSSNKRLGVLGFKTIIYYLLSSLLAILVGLVLVNLTLPGIINGQPAGQTHLNLVTDPDSLSLTLSKVSTKSSADLADLFLRIIPTNIVYSAAQGKMLGLIFFSILFGYFMTKIKTKNSETLVSLWKGISETMMHVTQWVMKFAPYGVFALVAKTIATTGFDAFRPILIFFITVLVALLFHFSITLLLLLRFIAKVNPLKHFKAMIPALLTAFSTASSSATLPLTLQTVEEKAGVSRQTASFVLPLGATVNMDGTALYECIAAIFIAQAYGLHLSFLQQFTIVIVALITSIGVAGIPAASLVAITIILKTIGLPLEGLGLLLITDRLLDMFRTAVNVFSDSCGAVIIARTEGEETQLT